MAKCRWCGDPANIVKPVAKPICFKCFTILVDVVKEVMASAKFRFDAVAVNEIKPILFNGRVVRRYFPNEKKGVFNTIWDVIDPDTLLLFDIYLLSKFEGKDVRITIEEVKH